MVTAETSNLTSVLGGGEDKERTREISTDLTLPATSITSDQTPVLDPEVLEAGILALGDLTT